MAGNARLGYRCVQRPGMCRQAIAVESVFSGHALREPEGQITYCPADSFTEHKEFFFETGHESLP
jgi:hypothetical protein